jgi:hypothetical protein
MPCELGGWLCSMFEVATLFGGLSNEGFVQLPQSRLQLQQNSVATSCISAPLLPQQLQQQTIGGWQKWCGGNRQACCCCCCGCCCCCFPEVLNALGLGVNFLCDDGNKQRISSVFGTEGHDQLTSGSATRVSQPSQVTCHMSHVNYCAAPVVSTHRRVIIRQCCGAGCCSCLFRQCCGGCFLLAPHGHLTDNG